MWDFISWVGKGPWEVIQGVYKAYVRFLHGNSPSVIALDLRRLARFIQYSKAGSRSNSRNKIITLLMVTS